MGVSLAVSVGMISGVGVAVGGSEAGGVSVAVGSGVGVSVGLSGVGVSVSISCAYTAMPGVLKTIPSIKAARRIPANRRLFFIGLIPSQHTQVG